MGDMGGGGGGGGTGSQFNTLQPSGGCATPPCPAAMLGIVGLTTVSGTDPNTGTIDSGEVSGRLDIRTWSGQIGSGLGWRVGSVVGCSSLEETASPPPPPPQ